MNIVGNIIWILLGGLLISVEYFVGGIVLCLTIIGIPFGQRTVVTEQGSGCLSAVMNLLWLIFGGIWIALTHLVFGVLLCITIIGIPFGRQHFKLMSLAFTPFGRDIISY